MEFLRDRATLAWNIVFPVLLIFGFAFAFRGVGNEILSVGYLGELPADLEFFSLDQIEFIAYTDAEEAIAKVRKHQIDLLVDTREGAYYVNETSPEGNLSSRLLVSMHGDAFQQQNVSGRAIRYVDWFVPGVIGMNMMFSGVFGVGFVLVRYRKNGVLKRIKATPVSPLQFVSAQVASRFLIVVVTSVLVFTGTNLALRFMMLGSYVLLLVHTMLGIACMISLGLMFATRIRSEELASGVINLVTLPMLLASGVFFSLEGAQPVVRTISRVFPLTHFVDGARAIMLEGAGFADIAPSMVILLGFTVLFLGLASVLFRWE
jgi:ABC-type multidrug transport system permease subunit